MKVGGGSHSGRSMRMAGTVIVKAADELIEKSKKLAAVVLEAAETDLEFHDGKFQVVGTDREISLYALAEVVGSRSDLPEKLSVIEDNVMETPFFPMAVTYARSKSTLYQARIKLLATRQLTMLDVQSTHSLSMVKLMGASFRGGEALGELCAMDPESGQPLAGSFMDYHMPRADEYPSFKTELNEVPSPTNPLGVKAGGEGGTTPALAVLVNGFVDALRPFGVRDIQMPVTPRKVWELIKAGS